MTNFIKQIIDLSNPCEVCSVFDVDNDGIPDIVCGEYWYQGPDFTKKHKICDIKFDGDYLHDFSNYPMDVNGDGYLDIITGSWWDDGLYWRENPGPKGGEWKTHKVMELTNVETIRYYDIDGDGEMEIFPNCPNEPVFFVKLKDGRFTKHIISDVNAGHGLGVGDIDGDGKLEVITPAGIFHIPEGGPYTGLWELSDELTLPDGCSVPILIHDVNGDGLPDIIAAAGHNYGLFWYQQVCNNGKRTWIEHVIDNAWSQYHEMQLADINGDGKLELVTGKRYMAHNGNDPGDDGEVFVCYYTFRDDDKLYRHIIDYGSPQKEHSGVGLNFSIVDISGNGRPDIIAPGKEGLYLFHNEGEE